jgi:hypothetical protein
LILHPHVCPLPSIDPVCGVASIPGDIVSEFFSAMAGWFAATASWFLQSVGAALTNSTAPPVLTPWFAARQQVVLSVSASIALLALCGAAVHAVVHGSAGELVRTVLLRLPIAVLLGAGAAGLVGLALGATDQLSTMIAAGDGTSLTSALRLLAGTFALTGGPPGGVSVVTAALVILGSVALWVELVVRSAAITVTTSLLPLVLAASLWPPAVVWVRRLAETLGALVASKAVIVLVLSTALAALANAPSGAATGITGAALLGLAAFMPYVLLRLVPAIEGAAVSHLESVRHRAAGVAGSLPRQAVSMALAGAGGSTMPSVDEVGTNPIGMLPGHHMDLVAGTPLDPDASFQRGRPPISAVPASTGTHVFERDAIGPVLRWKPGRAPSD